MAKKAATPTTVTLKHLAAAIAEDQELSKKKAEEIMNDLVGRITKHLKKGERIRIVGLGILQVRKRDQQTHGSERHESPLNFLRRSTGMQQSRQSEHRRNGGLSP